jgi:hypothetical protein
MRTAKDQSSLVQSGFFGNPKKEGLVLVPVSGLGVKKLDRTGLTNTSPTLIQIYIFTILYNTGSDKVLLHLSQSSTSTDEFLGVSDTGNAIDGFKN